MNGIILDAQERWNKNLRSTRKNEKLSQENLAALMREQGFTTCTQKSISRWEQVGRKPGYAFPSYDKMVGLAKCLQVDVPYLTGDMGGRTYDEQYIANSIGTDPGVVALIKELEQYASEKIDYEDDGEPENITLYHNADELALFILDFVGSEFISKYRDFVAAWMNITPQDDTSKAKNEEARYRIPSRQRCAGNIPIRIPTHFSPKKAWNANATRICNASNTRRDYKRKYGRNCLSKEGPIPTKTR